MKKLTNYERETVVLFNEGEVTASIYTYNNKLINHLTAFSNNYPDICRIENTNEYGGVSFVLDKSRLLIHTKPPISEERRQLLSERGKRFGFKKRTGSKEKDGLTPNSETDSPLRLLTCD